MRVPLACAGDGRPSGRSGFLDRLRQQDRSKGGRCGKEGPAEVGCGGRHSRLEQGEDFSLGLVEPLYIARAFA